MEYKRYPKYKESDVAWLGEVPEHWMVRRLKWVAKCRNSNVDKKSVEGQKPVELCNYTDVYYNERISNNISFMVATASDEDIVRFSLRAGDTIITKDSETPDDIGIPALVDESAEGVICGYHLTLIRPLSIADGAYIFRVVESSVSAAQFYLGASGVTRYGLSKGTIDGLVINVPPLEEQQKIATFLDRETTRIDALIKKKQRLIELLKEKRQAVITQAVTKGLDPNVPMKDSGVEWLGEVPEHWSFCRMKDVCSSIIDCKNRTPPQVDDSKYFVVRTTCVKNGKFSTDGGYFTDHKSFIEWTQRGTPRAGDILITREAPMGEVCLAPENIPFCLGQRMMLYRPAQELLDQNFALYALQGPLVQDFISMKSQGSTVGHLRVPDVYNMPILVPPIDEQKEIMKYVEKRDKSLTTLLKKVKVSLELLIEHRSALITAAVTGQIDVRNIA
ncbi:MAG: restriction endonuclease subunit S [gamma proteobacterium symbiont of Ctena orbiculata]|nr:MAG: restriction endonuclease subunit S [gamma proteobacterium symbiont of Ctena orbiculata]